MDCVFCSKMFGIYKIHIVLHVDTKITFSTFLKMLTLKRTPGQLRPNRVSNRSQLLYCGGNMFLNISPPSGSCHKIFPLNNFSWYLVPFQYVFTQYLPWVGNPWFKFRDPELFTAVPFFIYTNDRKHGTFLIAYHI